MSFIRAEEYDLNIKNEVCAMQLSKDLVGVTKEQMEDVVIAYEPVWAIGTGLVCGAEEASKYPSAFSTSISFCFNPVPSCQDARRRISHTRLLFCQCRTVTNRSFCDEIKHF